MTRFIRSLWTFRSWWLRSPIDWHNLRALWLQRNGLDLHDPEMTGEEAEAFLAALDALSTETGGER